MPDALKKIKSKITRSRGNQGFTLVETLIAGLLLTLVMTAVGRLSLSAMAGSSNLAERRKVEAAIDNHIQLVQQADSLLTYERLPSKHRTGDDDITRACRKPAQYFAKALQQKGRMDKGAWETQLNEDNQSTEDSVPNSVQLFDGFNDPEAGKISIKTTYKYDNDKSVAIIEYTFEAPENNIEEERRSLELSPNFQSYCTPYEA